MKRYSVVLVDETLQPFWADEWTISPEGHLILKRGTNSQAAVIAAGKWMWIADEECLRDRAATYENP